LFLWPDRRNRQPGRQDSRRARSPTP
jgi:hypothetical protein